MAAGSPSQPQCLQKPERKSIIKPRERRERKQYTDDWNVPEEELEGKRNFHLEDKLSDEKYSHQLVKHISGHEFGLAYMQQNGFKEPILVKEKAGLGLKVPDASFTIDDVRASVGSRRNLDVMDVLTQKNMEMSMKEFQLYWENPNKDKLLNVISLEFSHTRLEHYVEAPLVVRQIDWVDNVWPQHLKELQTESTNVLEDMMYPKVQKYVLMSVKGCYTDFHIDFGGTSVWYHVLKGRKVFWLIPPTSRNLELYEQWVLSGKQGDIFFGDTVEKCSRVVLEAGNTFFIPTGWIHAVYTPEDSLVFGGNFLHSFSIQKQLQIAQVEDTTHVPQKFRYPFFTEMLWYVLDRYVACLLGRSHLALPKEKEKDENDVKTEPQETLVKKEHQHLTQMELHGLKSIVIYLHSLARTKKCVPELVTDPVALIKDMKELVEQHKDDQPDLAVTGKPIISWPRESKVKRKPILRKYGMNGSKSREVKKASRSDRRRRVRCKRCIACTRNDCGKCIFCRDMVKFGGPGRMKQSCLERQCRQPQLPVTSVCSKCEVNGYQGLAPDPEMPSDLMECSICYKILHPKCAKVEMPDVDGITNEDLPNSWECPHCVKEGLHINAKPRHFKAREKRQKNELKTKTNINGEGHPTPEIKIEDMEEMANEKEREEDEEGDEEPEEEEGEEVDDDDDDMEEEEEEVEVDEEEDEEDGDDEDEGDDDEEEEDPEDKAKGKSAKKRSRGSPSDLSENGSSRRLKRARPAD